jgi:hypothetical protein
LSSTTEASSPALRNDLAQRAFHGAQCMLHMPWFWSSLSPLEVADRLDGANQRDTTTRNDAFLDGSASRVQRVFNAGLLLFHFDLGGSAYLDHGHTTGQLGDALLQLLTVVVRAGVLDLHADFLDARFDGCCGHRHRR